MTIIFDLGGVIVDLDRQRCIDNFRKLGLQHIDQMLGNFRQEGLFLQLEKGEISNEVFRLEVRNLIGQQVSDTQIDDAWNSFLVGAPAYKLDFILRLRQQHTIFLLSNTNDIHWQWCRKEVFSYKGANINDFFDRTFLSHEMHCAKPEPEIFERIISEGGISPQDALFIDDGEANCLAAARLGIQTYHAKPSEDWTHLFTSI